VRPLDFDDPPGLVASLAGATTLYNTYWVRFAHERIDHALAVENSRMLFHAARRGGIRKIVHVSILHPSAASPYSYFRGKALVERALAETGLPYAALRPSVLFDERGMLLNNIAWLLRRLPVFAIGGNGSYRVRPIHVGDLASLALEAATWPDDRIVDAVGAERPTFIELVRQIRAAVDSRARIVKVPARLLLTMSRALGVVLSDVLLTTDEYRSMAEGLADSDAPATGNVRLSTWVVEHSDTLGVRYANELGRTCMIKSLNDTSPMFSHISRASRGMPSSIASCCSGVKFSRMSPKISQTLSPLKLAMPCAGNIPHSSSVR
jgi:NADH dehydrogenase